MSKMYNDYLIRNQEYMINDLYHLNKYQWLDSDIHSNWGPEFDQADYPELKKYQQDANQYFNNKQSNKKSNLNLNKIQLLKNILTVSVYFGLVCWAIYQTQVINPVFDQMAQDQTHINQLISINQDQALDQ